MEADNPVLVLERNAGGGLTGDGMLGPKNKVAALTLSRLMGGRGGSIELVESFGREGWVCTLLTRRLGRGEPDSDEEDPDGERL